MIRREQGETFVSGKRFKKKGPLRRPAVVRVEMQVVTTGRDAQHKEEFDDGEVDDTDVRFDEVTAPKGRKRRA